MFFIIYDLLSTKYTWVEGGLDDRPLYNDQIVCICSGKDAKERRDQVLKALNTQSDFERYIKARKGLFVIVWNRPLIRRWIESLIEKLERLGGKL